MVHTPEISALSRHGRKSLSSMVCPSHRVRPYLKIRRVRKGKGRWGGRERIRGGQEKPNKK